MATALMLAAAAADGFSVTMHAISAPLVCTAAAMTIAFVEHVSTAAGWCNTERATICGSRTVRAVVRSYRQSVPESGRQLLNRGGAGVVALASYLLAGKYAQRGALLSPAALANVLGGVSLVLSLWLVVYMLAHLWAVRAPALRLRAPRPAARSVEAQRNFPHVRTGAAVVH
ncbi:MAG: hypothetical protein EOO41_01885 [Methanobacteriota archaeon]|nr:MAG: hypothetical protein EOO41_01885 [Euryarchaeota archaeon]